LVKRRLIKDNSMLLYYVKHDELPTKGLKETLSLVEHL